MHTLSIVGRKINRKKRKREKCRGWLGETDNNYTCPRRPREPDHVAMETQVQQKVTGKSIPIELISPSLLLPLSLFTPFSFHTGYKARFLSESQFNCCRADVALIPHHFSIFIHSTWQMWSIVTRKKDVFRCLSKLYERRMKTLMCYDSKQVAVCLRTTIRSCSFCPFPLCLHPWRGSAAARRW